MAKIQIQNICLGCFGPLDSARFCFKCRKRADDMPKSWTYLHPRTVLNGRYLIADSLGQGGFGITYSGWDAQTGSKIAIKEFFPKSICERPIRSNIIKPLNDNLHFIFEQYKDMFVNEIQLLQKTSAMPGIVNLFDFFNTNNSIYFVMDFVSGISLNSFAARFGGRLPLNQVLMLLMPIFESIKHIHKIGLIHRDISPENIIISENGKAKLIDFGAAMIYTRPLNTQFTQVKHGFAPVEQYTSNLPQGPWTDVYSLAATIYKCITGVIPPPAPSRVQSDSLIAPSRFGIKIEPYREQALLKALSLRKRDRFNDLCEFAETLIGAQMLGALCGDRPAQSQTPIGLNTAKQQPQQPQQPQPMQFGTATQFIQRSATTPQFTQQASATVPQFAQQASATVPQFATTGTGKN